MRNSFIIKLLASIMLVLLLMSCETNPNIYLPSNPQPVIYGIFNLNDSIHYVKVGRSFGTDNTAYSGAQLYDSLYSDDIEVEVHLTADGKPVGMPIEVYPIVDLPKDSGYFLYPGQRLYGFTTHFGGHQKQLMVRATIPGLPTAEATTNLVTTGIIYQPDAARMYVYMVPTQAFLIQWDGNPWNEIDVSFEFIEDYGDSVYQSQYVHMQKTNYFDSQYDLYREMRVTYDEFIREVLQQLPRNEAVKQLFLGYISVTIHAGDENMVNYIKYKDGFNDFGVVEFSNVTNGIGLIASRATQIRDSLRFDYQTRQMLINDNRLKVLKISPWQ